MSDAGDSAEPRKGGVGTFDHDEEGACRYTYTYRCFCLTRSMAKVGRGVEEAVEEELELILCEDNNFLCCCGCCWLLLSEICVHRRD